jgi:hypothetical protein
MKKYYLHTGTTQAGPFDVEELRQKGITRTTLVWCEGLPAWTEAQRIAELQSLFQATAPQFASSQQQYQTHPHAQPFTHPVQAGKKSNAGWIITLIALFLVLGIGAIVLINNPNAVPGVSVDINTPKPTVVTSRANGNKSGLLNARTTVYATVMNQGGDGNVLVTFYVYQGNYTYDRTESIYMRSGDAEDLEVTFEEVDYISGEVTYNVFAEAQ